MTNHRTSIRDLKHTAFAVPVGVRNQVVVQGFTGVRVPMEDENFHFDSAVMLPVRRAEDAPDLPIQDRLSGLAALQACYEHAQAHPEDKVVVAGHADRSNHSGDPNFNLKLSLLRAKNVLALLVGDREGWAEIAHQRHRTEDIQAILQWVAREFGFDCDPGEVDGDLGPDTRRATAGFQRAYNAGFGGALAVDGVVGPETWKAIFDVYVEELKRLLDVDDAGLASLQRGIEFADPGHQAVGCGDNHPAAAVLASSNAAPSRGATGGSAGAVGSRAAARPGDTPAQRVELEHAEGAPDRRVDILFFPPGHLPQFPCHPSETTCNPGLCEIYRLGFFKLDHIKPGRKRKNPPFRYGFQIGDGAPFSTAATLILRSEDGSFERVFDPSEADMHDGFAIFTFNPRNPGVRFVGMIRDGDSVVQVFGPVDLSKLQDPQDTSVSGLPLPDDPPVSEQPPVPPAFVAIPPNVSFATPDPQVLATALLPPDDPGALNQVLV